ncbi:MAG TPA: ABC transporter ATP-binding protein [Acidimicrobiales bacterium]|nr:ABC transporter ATP-binding protein [Acidimicrobiales bacterium]
MNSATARPYWGPGACKGGGPREDVVADEGESTIGGVRCDPEARVSLRRLPALAREGVRLVWAAARRELLLVLALQAVSGVAVTVALVVGRRGLDRVLAAVDQGASLASVAPWALLLAALVAVNLAVNALQRERQQLLGELVVRYVEEQVLDVSTSVDLDVFDTSGFHDRVMRMKRASHSPLDLVWGLTGLAQGAIGVVGVVVAFLAVAPLVIPLMALVLLPVWLGASRRSQLFYRYFWRMTPRDRERSYLFFVLTGRHEAKEVRAFGSAAYLGGRHNRLYDERLDELRAVARRSGAYAVLAALGMGAVLAAMLLLVVWLTVRGDVRLADAGVAVAGVGVLGGRLASAGQSMGSLSESALYLEDYRTFLEEHPTRADGPEPNRASAARGFRRLEVEGLTFTYPTAESPALVDVALEIDAGEVVALVGENGSGKTTLAKLLAGLYTRYAGAIRWDGVDVTALDAEELRGHVAVIFQDFLRYCLSVRENIGLGRWEAIEDQDAVERAATQAGADEFLRRLSHGYDTWLGPEFDGGTELSTGQWQRIALARAFFRDAPFVILDEPTAALDAKAEHELFARIRSLLAGRTVLLISHRFSSVRSADRIYVLHDGRIVESGDHDRLLALGGRYAEMFTLQASAYRDGSLDGGSTNETLTYRSDTC